MRAFFVVPTLIAALTACTIDLPIGGRDVPAATDVPLDAEREGGADTSGFDTGPGCVIGESRCGADGREVCVFVGASSWLRAPCDDYEVCVGGLCETPTGRDLVSLASAPGWLHPDVGITGTGEAVGPDAFPQGLVLVNPYAQRVEGRAMSASEVGAPRWETLEPWSTTRVLTSWSPRLAQVALDGSVAPGRSYWEPSLFSQTWEGFPLLIPLAIWMGSPASGTNVLDPSCVVSSPPARCRPRSLEATLVSGEMGTSFVVGALPAAAHYDACTDELVVRGLPFLGVTNASAVNTIDVTSTARFQDGEPPVVPFDGIDPPPPIEPGGTARVALNGAGSWQLVVAPPRTIEECEPAPSTECLRPCTARALDLSGTRITTTRPSSVTIGHTCASAAPGAPCGYALETVPSIEALGTIHHVPGPASFESGDVLVHMVAVSEGTVVSSPEGTRTLAAGDTVTFRTPTDAVVSASAPVLVTRYSHRPDGGLAVTLARPEAELAREHLVPSGVSALVVLSRGDALRLDGADVSASRRAFVGAELEVVELTVGDDGAAHTLETTSPSNVLVAWVLADSSLLAISRGARR